MKVVVTIARLTIWEASRRKLLIALMILTGIVMVLSGWGFHELTLVHNRDGTPIGTAELRTVAFGLLDFLVFMFSCVLALSAAVVAAPSLSGEIESGQVLSMLARPVRRSDVIFGKWIGLLLLVAAYAGICGVLEMLIVDVATGFQVPHPIEVVTAVFAEGVVLLTLGLALSTRVSGITGAVVAVICFLMATIYARQLHIEEV